MNRFIFVLLLLPMLAISCKEEDCCVIPEGASLNVFARPEKGAESRYIAFVGEKFYDTTQSQVTYLADTLVVTVLDRSGNTFRIQERFSEGSQLLQRIRSGEISLDSVFTYDMVRRDDRWEFIYAEADHFKAPLFNFFHEPQLTLSLSAQADTCQVVGAKILNCTGQVRVQDWPSRGRIYPEILGYQDQNQIIFDGPAYTWMYGPQAGMVMTYTVSPWSQQWSGWEWLE